MFDPQARRLAVETLGEHLQPERLDGARRGEVERRERLAREALAQERAREAQLGGQQALRDRLGKLLDQLRQRGLVPQPGQKNGQRGAISEI